jgi:hypothetical protein
MLILVPMVLSAALAAGPRTMTPDLNGTPTKAGVRCANPDSRIPSDVPPDNRCEWLDYTRAPAGFPDAIAWVNALSLGGPTCKVEFDFIKLHECVAGRDSILWATEFNVQNQEVCGDTYKRVPWFNYVAGGGGESDLPFTLDPLGYVVLDPASRPTRVFHLWNCGWPRKTVTGTSGVWTEVRVRITGAAAVQVGYDFWQGYPPGARNVQGGESDWYFATSDWQIIRVGAGCR